MIHDHQKEEDDPEEVIPAETLARYYEKSGDNYLGVAGVPCEWEYNEKHGFIVFYCHDKDFWIVNCYGDGAYWDAWAMERARLYGCDKILFLTVRNPEAFERKHGYTLKGYLMQKDVGTKH